MFIPKQKLQIGSFVKTTEVIHTEDGRFTKGHIFKCIDIGERGPDFQDEEGRKLFETALMGTFYKIINPKNMF